MNLIEPYIKLAQLVHMDPYYFGPKLGVSGAEENDRLCQACLRALGFTPEQITHSHDYLTANLLVPTSLPVDIPNADMPKITKIDFTTQEEVAKNPQVSTSSLPMNIPKITKTGLECLGCYSNKKNTPQAEIHSV